MDRYSAQSQPGKDEGQRDDNEQPEGRRFDQRRRNRRSWLDCPSLSVRKEYNESPEKTDCCPAGESMDHLEKVVHSGSEGRVGEDEDADQKSVQDDCNDPDSESGTTREGALWDVDNDMIEQTKPDNCSYACTTVHSPQMIDLGRKTADA